MPYARCRGLEAIKSSARVYLEAYTSLLLVPKETLVRVGYVCGPPPHMCRGIPPDHPFCLHANQWATATLPSLAQRHAWGACSWAPAAPHLWQSANHPPPQPLVCACMAQEAFYGKEVIVADREMVEMVRGVEGRRWEN
jgi:hypothetical protein